MMTDFLAQIPSVMEALIHFSDEVKRVHVVKSRRWRRTFANSHDESRWL